MDNTLNIGELETIFCEYEKVSNVSLEEYVCTK